MKKIKLSDFARDLNISTADLLQFFYEKGDNRKKAASALTVEEADWILEKITQDNMADSFNDFFAYARRDYMFKNEDFDFSQPIDVVLRKLHTGETVTGTIVAIAPPELTVDIGTKHTCYINWRNLSRKTSKYFVGDKIKAVVDRVDNAEGTAELIELEVMEQRHKLKHQEKQQNTTSVANEVMSQVQEKLTQMKPALISEVAISVYSHLEKGLADENAELKNKVSELEKRVKNLESLIDKMKLR